MVRHDLRCIGALEPGHRFITVTPMTKPRAATSGVEFHPLRPNCWGDLEKLFGERGAAEAAGACGGDCHGRNGVDKRVPVINLRCVVWWHRTKTPWEYWPYRQ